MADCKTCGTDFSECMCEMCLACGLCKSCGMCFCEKGTTIAPIVHLNGTSKSDLINALSTAANAVSSAEKALRETAPHGRDYYVHKNPNAYRIALDHYRVRQEKLASIIEDLQEIAIKISDQNRFDQRS
jgi:hypothetical protein